MNNLEIEVKTFVSGFDITGFVGQTFDEAVPISDNDFRHGCNDFMYRLFRTNYQYQQIQTEYFNHFALVRYLEIWGGNLTSARFVRGFKANINLRRSFAGMLGSNNNAVSPKDGLVKGTNGTWQIVNLASVYPFIPRLTKEGIESCRKIAYELASRERKG